MKNLFIAFIGFIAITSNVLAQEAMLIDVNKIQQEESQKRVDKYYEEVISELGILYGHYKIAQRQRGLKSNLYNFCSKLLGLEKRKKYVKYFNKSFKSSSILLTKVTWPLSYEAGGSIRKEQIGHMQEILPNMYYSEKSFLVKIAYVLTLAFPAQSEEFYSNAISEIEETGETKFYLDKHS